MAYEVDLEQSTLRIRDLEQCYDTLFKSQQPRSTLPAITTTTDTSQKKAKFHTTHTELLAKIEAFAETYWTGTQASDLGHIHYLAKSLIEDEGDSTTTATTPNQDNQQTTESRSSQHDQKATITIPQESPTSSQPQLTPTQYTTAPDQRLETIKVTKQDETATEQQHTTTIRLPRNESTQQPIQPTQEDAPTTASSSSAVAVEVGSGTWAAAENKASRDATPRLSSLSAPYRQQVMTAVTRLFRSTGRAEEESDQFAEEKTSLTGT
jgi:hypothetical protein